MLEEIANDEATFTIIDSENFLYIEGGVIAKNGITPLPAPGENDLIDAALSGITSGHAVGPEGQELIYATSTCNAWAGNLFERYPINGQPRRPRSHLAILS